MRSEDYWRNRTMLVEDTLHNKGVEYYQHLHDQYRLAAKKTQQEVTVLYNKLAANNGISMVEAKRLLTTNELDEFRWTVDQYIKYGKANAVSGQWMKQLENASLRYRISRLEAMKIQMQHNAEVLFASEADGMTKMLSDMYTEGYYRTAHMIETGFGVKHSFAKLDDRRIEKVIGKPWAADGKNFSERIWNQHRPALVNDLHTGLTQSIIRGDAPDKLIQNISKKYDVASSKAGNLVMTESAYFGNASQQDCYAELGVEEQQFCATLDTRTSDLCRSMDLKIVKSSDVVIGTNAPPLHCRCRSVMVPYFDDMEGETRIARDADGKNIKVPSDMSYDEWYDKYIKGTAADKPKRKRNTSSKKPAALKERVEGIKQDLTGHEQRLTNQKVELQSKKTELKITNDDIDELYKTQTDLEVQRDDYNRLKDRDFDAEIAKQTKLKEEHAARVAELEKQHSRYYDRPERGTPEREEWSNWRKGIDYEELFNDLVDEKSKVVRADIELENLTKNKKKLAAIDIDDVTKKLDRVESQLVEKKSSVATLKGDIKHLTDGIADTRLTIEDTYKRAGKEFINELDNVKLLGGDELADLRKKNDAAYKAYLKETDRAKRLKLFDEYAEINKSYFDMKRRMGVENTAAVKDALSQVRSLGASNVDDLVKVHLGNSRSKVFDAVKKAYEHYPTEWVDASAAAGKVSLKKVDRGFYSHWSSTIAISGTDEASQLQTAIHELAHRFERTVDDMRDLEKTFYERRTDGEALQWLGGRYSKSEKSRFDDFIDRYMGKDYGGDAYEIISMGFEYGFSDPLKLMEDTDMAEFIYGLLMMK